MDFSWISCAGPCIGRSSFAPTIHDHPIRVSTLRTLAIFEHSTGVRLPPDTISARARADWIQEQHPREWVDFKCRVVSEFVAEARCDPEGREAGRRVGPLHRSRRRRPERGADRPASARSRAPSGSGRPRCSTTTSFFRPSSWIGEALAEVVRVAGQKTLPVLQADSNRDPGLAADWGPPMSSRRLEGNTCRSGRPLGPGWIGRFPGCEPCRQRPRRVAKGRIVDDSSQRRRPGCRTLCSAQMRSTRASARLSHCRTSRSTLASARSPGSSATTARENPLSSRIISGVLRADDGKIEFDGAHVDFASPAEARARGIETVYQDLALVGKPAGLGQRLPWPRVDPRPWLRSSCTCSTSGR